MEFRSVVDDIDKDVDINRFFNDSESESDSEENIDDYDDIILGIDLGTTNSAVAVIRNNNYEIIPDEYGNRTVPSAVAFTKLSKYVGVDAKNQTEISPENTYYEVKRLIGKRFSDEVVQNDLPFFTYKVVGDVKDNIYLRSDVLLNKPLISPEEISSHILRKLKDMAQNYLKKNVKRAVITVPAYFNDTQREATKDAARIAGLECVRIINEPTAAALMYGLHHRTKDISETMVLVYDLGGGTLDCSILCISDGIFEVLASTGNTHLGGADFDKSLMRYCINWFKKKYGYEKLNDVPAVSVQKLKNACERAKKLLSSKDNTTIAVKNFYDNKDIFIKIDSKTFYQICKDMFILCLKPVEDVLDSAGLDREDIDEIILVGGATRMKLIRDNIKTFFRGKEPNMSVDPDEVVAAGAAIQGHIIANVNDPFSNSVVLLDILPLSLGVETIGGEMTTIIPRNTRIPCRKTKKFTTDDDNMTAVTIKVFEGERKLTKDNFKIAEFDLENLEPAPRGVAKIDITYSVDVNGIINITAVDMRNDENKSNMIAKCNKGRLTAGEIERLIKEAEKNDMKDKYDSAVKRLIYEIGDLCNNVLTNLKNDEFKLKPKDAEMITEDIDKVLKWLNKVKKEEKKKKELERVVERLNKRYGTLILKLNSCEDNVKAENTGDVVSTSVYGNDEDDEDEKKVFEEIEDDEFGFNKDDNDEIRRKTKELRNQLTDICSSLFDILYSGSLNISKEELQKIKDIVDDTMLWTHVKQKIKISEYEEKIDEINRLCDDLVKNNENLFKKDELLDINSKKDELEQLCYAIKTSLSSNLYSIEESKIKDLNSYLDECLEWLLEIDVEDKKVDDEEYEKRIENINDICNNLYNDMLDINLKFNTSTAPEEQLIDSGTDGKSIAELIEMNKKLINNTHNSSS